MNKIIELKKAESFAEYVEKPRYTMLQSIYNEPEKWRLSKHRFIHSEGGSVWIASGFIFANPDPGGDVGIIHKIRLWRAFRWWQKNAPIEAFG